MPKTTEETEARRAIGVGILGFAHGHVGMYCTQWREHPELGVSVVAGWDHDAQRLQKAATTHGLRGYAQVDDLLSAPGVEDVVIGAETSLHADLVERAAAAGKAIVLQKPLALTMVEADRIVAAVQRHGVPFTLAWQMRVDPQNVKIKELMESCVLGKIFMVRRRHGLGVHTWPNYADLWHLKPDLNRDIWADDAAHAIDFVYWLLGAPDTATAEMATLYDPRMAMDNIAGLAAPLADFLHGQRPPIATAEEGRLSLCMTLACYVSTREGRRVRLDDASIAQV